ncbi:acyl-CoA dehydrogenase family protein [Sphingopyxis sp.]|uniref:acyl-CoA dehydrogenase family protein n=1 Tax=Sphingopyxis sp. TaxID=1908224 RepID=UPI001DBA715E|nr:acyl-CoA dehydrogenase family protein [Sphingopyxis sp.]MBW8297496.1 acyl-CoA/acyl-ACP dehydrogenase [Sphingopyxis sp.]
MAIDLSFNDTQTMLRDSAREFFGAKLPLTKLRERTTKGDFSEAIWREMADLGWLGMGLPEACGGFACSLSDFYAFYLEMGRQLVDVPHLESVVVAGGLIAAAGRDADHATLAAIAAGDTVVAPALFEENGGHCADDVHLTIDGGRLRGRKMYVRFAGQASHLLVAARDGGRLALFLVEATQPGVTITSLPNIARTPLYRVDVDLLVGELARIGGGRDITAEFNEVIARAAILLAAEVAGAGERILEFTVNYAKERSQFGVPIGKYQAIQYLCTDIALHYRHTSLFALHAASREGEEDFLLRASLAKAEACRAAGAMTFASHEVHAGIGFMEDYDLQLFTRRAKLWENLYGDRRAHLEMIARLA